MPIADRDLWEGEGEHCAVCQLGPCPTCGRCCGLCVCEPEDDDDVWDLSDMEDDRYFWDR